MVKVRHLEGKNLANRQEFANIFPLQIFPAYGSVNHPANLSFTGPIHTTQFDHNGGTLQSLIHKVSLVVPPNALSDGEKVTVYIDS